MINKRVLRQPDFTKPFFLLTDASAYGVGAILS
jgi:RNase H-like domain found in reverse transcriptase